MPSPGEGVVAKILVQEGETVEVGTRARGDRARRAPSVCPPKRLPEPRDPRRRPRRPPPLELRGRRTPSPRRRSRRRRRRPADRPRRAAAAPGRTAAVGNGRTFVSPVVARIASEHGVDPNRCRAPAGRPRDEEGHPGVRRVRRPAAPAAQPASPPAPSRSPQRPQPHRLRRRAPPPGLRPGAAAPAQPPPAAPAPAPAAAGPRRRSPARPFEPMTAMRKGIAEHMRRSLDTSAHVTSAIEVDMSKVVAIRAEAEEGVRGRLRRQPDVPLLRRPRDRRDAAGLPVDQRRDPRRQDRHAATTSTSASRSSSPTARA